MFLPVVIRELSVRARQGSTFHARTAAAGIVALIIGAALAVAALSRAAGAMPIGSQLLQGITILLLLYVLVEGARQAAGGISQERREGTLGFLFLTDLTALDVLLGKLSGAALTALYTLLATLPFAGLAMLFGGVTGGEFFRSILALLAALAVALGCGAWASVRCRDGMAAVVVATALLLGALAVPPAVDALWHARTGGFQLAEAKVGLFSPLIGIALTDDLSQRLSAPRFWWSLVAQVGLAALLVADAARRLHGLWRRDESAPRLARRTRSAHDAKADFGGIVAATMASRIHLGRWLVGLIALTLMAHAGQVLLWFAPQAMAATGLSMMLTSIPAGLAGLVRTLLFVHLATRVFAEARHTGEMEILLTTRLGDDELVRLLWRTLRKMVFWLVGTDIVLGALGTLQTFANLPAAAPAGSFESGLVVIVCQSISSAFDWVALTWSAMWFGISSRRTGIAIAKTFGVEIGLAMAASIAGVAIAIPLQFLLMRLQPGGGAVSAYVFVLPMTLLHIGLNHLRFRWSRKRLTTQFRQAAAGTGS